MWSDAIELAPGTVSQVRGSAQALIRFAKTSGAALLLVGHVTKDGQIAGPRVVEHMVDAVSRSRATARMLSVCCARRKTGSGHRRDRRVRNDRRRARRGRQPSALFLAGRDGKRAGRGGVRRRRGARPVLVEIQALVAPTTLGTPRRAVVGWDLSASPWCWRCSKRMAG